MAISDHRKFVTDMFGVDIDSFIEAIKLSPGSQGYIMGAVSEYLLLNYLINKGFELKRITEKWKGPKPLRHHGDFYIRKNTSDKWYVLESKGLKSNAEKWMNLNDRRRLNSYLKGINRTYNLFDSNRDIDIWCENNYESDLSKLKIKILMTHFVAGKTKLRSIATCRNDEFDYISIDPYLRTGKHEFIFADPKALSPSRSNPNHLQQNYTIDILVDGIKDEVIIEPPWHTDINDIWDEARTPINKEEMNIDERGIKSWRELLRRF